MCLLAITACLLSCYRAGDVWANGAGVFRVHAVDPALLPGSQPNVSVLLREAFAAGGHHLDQLRAVFHAALSAAVQLHIEVGGGCDLYAIEWLSLLIRALVLFFY